MSVYVDDARIPFGPMRMCHMVADSELELRCMCDRIGLSRRWLHRSRRRGVLHANAGIALRRLAIEAGAVPVTRRELGRIVRRLGS